MKKIIFPIYLLSLSTSAVFGADVTASELWECGVYTRIGTTDWSSRAATLTIHSDGNSGEARIAGQAFDASYTIEGINRRWDWGSRYSIVLRPDGEAAYYDFNFADEEGRAKPRMTLPCRRATVENQLERINMDELLKDLAPNR